MSDAVSHPEAPGAAGAPATVLDEQELQRLREAGRSWGTVSPPRPEAGGLDPDLDVVEERGSMPGQRYIRVVRSRKQGFEKVEPGWLQVTPRATEPHSRAGRVAVALRKRLLGAPLATSRLAHERLSKKLALAVLSSDSLSSVAYGPEAIIVVLIAAGSVGLNALLPITAVIVVLLAALILSYRQIIKAYPSAGGSYIVAKENFSPLYGLIAASALMTDYVLTVAVSVASGVLTITSAFPSADPYRVEICVAIIGVIMLGNLRGLQESASIFALPTYLFILGIFGMIAVLFVKVATGDFSSAGHTVARASEPLSILIILRAFASGCSSLTGIEAISNGVSAFKPVEWKNARTTLTIMGCLLGGMLVGMTVLMHIGALSPRSNENMLSQLAHHAFGSGVGYYYVIVTTTLVLILAANTSFTGFPRLFYTMALDDYAPHQFKRLGDRLAFSNGILVLGLLAIVLEVAFKGNVDRLIPLYTIGVFLAFALANAGMVRRWWRLRGPGWRAGVVINSVGMVLTAVVFMVTAGTKAPEGAWVVLLLIPVLVLLFRAVHRHYGEAGDRQTTEIPTTPSLIKPVCIVPVADLDSVALQSLALARTICDSVVAVHITDDAATIARLRAKWEAWGNHVPLEIIESPYRTIVRPLLAYIDAVDRQRQKNATIVVVLPELVATRWWHHLLHNQTALRIKAALLFRPGTVVVSVPYHLRRVARARRRLRIRDSGVDAI